MPTAATDHAGTTPLVVACGALVAELRTVLAAAGLADAIDVQYLPANLHNRPEGIVAAVTEVLAAHGALDHTSARPVLLGYADCGTGGGLDSFIAAHPHITRLPGAHCYEFFAGGEAFAALHEAELGTFYLTDFLALHFEALVWQGLGLHQHPQLRDMYFGNYRRVVLLSQRDDAEVVAAGQRAAHMLGLEFHHHPTGHRYFADAVSVGLGPRATGKAA
ncbi:MAG: DUF1638 domain-containing protein [Actinomycetota bacterium]